MNFLITYPSLGCNGSAWKRGVRMGAILEHVYDNDDDNVNNNNSTSLSSSSSTYK